MARPSLKAEFFVDSYGCVVPRATPLLRSQAFAFWVNSDKHCAKCRRPVRFGGTTTDPFEAIKAGHIDHKFPRARGGQNDHANLQVLCITCNASKGAA